MDQIPDKIKSKFIEWTIDNIYKPDMPSIQQLRYLVAIADTLHFSRAAEIVHVSQPTLSMQIRTLEERLGAQLIERNRARTMLTPTGTEVVRRARRILAEVETIRDIARSDEASWQRVLRLGSVHTVGAYLLSVVMPELRHSHPDLRLYVREDNRDHLQRQLSEGVHDLLILPDHPRGSGLEIRTLLYEPLHLVLPAGHRLAAQARIDPADLEGETMLTMERGHRMHDQIATICRSTGAILAGDYEGTTLDTLRQMVATGMGISLLPALYIRSEVMRETLVVARPLSGPTPLREITMAWRPTSPLGLKFETLARLMQQCAAPWAAGTSA